MDCEKLYVAYHDLNSKRFYVDQNGDLQPFLGEARKYKESETATYDKGERRVRQYFGPKSFKVIEYEKEEARASQKEG